MCLIGYSSCSRSISLLLPLFATDLSLDGSLSLVYYCNRGPKEEQTFIRQHIPLGNLAQRRSTAGASRQAVNAMCSCLILQAAHQPDALSQASCGVQKAKRTKHGSSNSSQSCSSQLSSSSSHSSSRPYSSSSQHSSSSQSRRSIRHRNCLVLVVIAGPAMPHSPFTRSIKGISLAVLIASSTSLFMRYPSCQNSRAC